MNRQKEHFTGSLCYNLVKSNKQINVNHNINSKEQDRRSDSKGLILFQMKGM